MISPIIQYVVWLVALGALMACTFGISLGGWALLVLRPEERVVGRKFWVWLFAWFFFLSFVVLGPLYWLELS